MFTALPLQAQIDSTATAQNIPQLERIAILAFSGAEGRHEQSENFAQALRAVCRDEARFIVVSEISLAAYLKKHRGFSVFAADSVQALCKNLALDYLIAATIESAAPSTPAPSHNSWQVALRWLDGSSGQMTKIHTAEYDGDIDALESFPLAELWTSLLESPDIIVPLENQLPPLVALPPAEDESVTESAAVDQTAAMLPPAQIQNKRRRSWFWYITGAALISGGSAAALLKNSSKNPVGKKILPEPPQPPM